VLVLLLALTVWLLPKLWRFLRGFVERLLRWFGYPGSPNEPESQRRGDV
jgi:hypothetical protein